MLRLAVVSLLSALSAVPQANAQDDSRTLVESSHVVRVTFADGSMRLRVSRTFHNRGSQPEPFRIELGLPGTAVVDKLRVRFDGRWIAGVLHEPDKAAAILEGLGNSERKTRRARTAILEIGGRDAIQLAIPFLRPRQSVRVEYEVLAPTCLIGGRFSIAYPFSGADSDGDVKWRRPQLRGRGVVAQEDVELDEESNGISQQACHGSHAGLDEELNVSIAGPKETALRWGTVRVGQREVARVELDVGKSCSKYRSELPWCLCSMARLALQTTGSRDSWRWPSPSRCPTRDRKSSSTDEGPKRCHPDSPQPAS